MGLQRRHSISNFALRVNMQNENFLKNFLAVPDTRETPYFIGRNAFCEMRSRRVRRKKFQEKTARRAAAVDFRRECVVQCAQPKQERQMKKFTFSNNITEGAKAHQDAFGNITPEGLPWQLCWPSAYPDPLECDATCKEYGDLLARCVKRGKPVTVREYVDFFWKGDDGVYRCESIAEDADYGAFLREASEFDADF